ncbi:ribonucleotide reductase 2a [Phthorimaea operculella granulovirus]|uniref:ribonucleoside-diphosphate reductase n=1 Tax=Phthorimaea operculella granulovirus TaxID=192584 RepID=Q8JRT9_9BBAC|nr:ribonucleotide reductase 2a [Phthorimaea operculella granulovirus]AAM70318.1 ribonucleotide reductase 2a [Phthorimaea operculella granulovirus]ANY57509.1 ribonucleotide reductase 2a [Phthorimaea operculella granulovirus]QBH65955.1 ribonucleotide reductase 2a [Phthorimaea operculella granulovirus]QBH66085.1 ribonucleotide reductase 2a [Phthorimaea operculella granulovirus]QBH66215.1 ribonucleotide reductase 2a [Phthorimaea operculella granulovirus]
MDRVNKWFAGVAEYEIVPKVEKFKNNFEQTGKSLQIWPPSYYPSWFYYQQHQANHWFANEHDPLDDLSGFEKITPAWQNALLQSFAALAIGDDKVMCLISENELQWEESTKWMFADQAARETTHKIAYNRMLELARVSTFFTTDTLTSDEYANYLMDKVDLDVSNVNAKAKFLITMMLCERYLFAAPFLIINLMGESGFINTCVKINMQVMKDEHSHYAHSVQVLHDSCQNFENIFNELCAKFEPLVESIVGKICIDLEKSQIGAIMDHTRFTLHTIYVDNRMEVPTHLKKYTSTPFLVFDKNTGVDKFNLMESNSTVYKAGKSLYYPDWNEIKRSVEEEEDKIK